MINLESNQVQIGDKVEPILEWTVFFITLEGAHESLEQAKDSCNRTGQPYYSIVPIPVAKCETIFEISLTQGVSFET